MQQVKNKIDIPFITICLNQTVKNDSHNLTWSATIQILGISVLTIALLCILYMVARKRVISKSKDMIKAPVIMGRYKRNIVTLSQTIGIFLSVITSALLTVLLTIVTNDTNWHLIELCLISIFAVYILYLYVTGDNYLGISAKTSVFYIRTPDIVPRRDLMSMSISQGPVQNPVNHNNVIFVRPIYEIV